MEVTWNMVKGVYTHSNRHWVVLQPCFLHTMDTLTAALPKRPAIFRNCPRFETIEDATCWGIAAQLRQSYLRPPFDHRDPDLRDLAFKVDVGVYILGAPVTNDGRFEEWFADANDSSYRILICSSPLYHHQQEVHPHRVDPIVPESPRLVRIGPLHLTTPQRKYGMAFVEEFAQAAWFGEVAVEHLLQKAGHRYWWSDGMPVGGDQGKYGP